MKFLVFILLTNLAYAQQQAGVVQNAAHAAASFTWNFQNGFSEQFNGGTAKSVNHPMQVSIVTPEAPALIKFTQPTMIEMDLSLVAPGTELTLGLTRPAPSASDSKLCDSTGPAPLTSDNAIASTILFPIGSGRCGEPLRLSPNLGSFVTFGSSLNSFSNKNNCDTSISTFPEPLHLSPDRDFCQCYQRKAVNVINPRPGREIKVAALKGLIQNYLSEVLKPSLQLKSELGYSPIPRQEGVCDLSTMSSRLGDLRVNPPVLDEAFCDKGQCAEGETLFNQAIIDLAGSDGAVGPADLRRRLDFHQTKNRGPITNSNGHETRSCLLNKRANVIAGMLPIQDGAGQSRTIPGLSGRKQGLESTLLSLGDCTNSQHASALRFTVLSEEKFDQLREIAPTAMTLFRSGDLSDTQLLQRCHSAKKVLKQGIDLLAVQERFESGLDYESSYRELEAIQDVIISATKEFPQEILKHLDDELYSSCQKFQNNIQQISCSKTGFVSGRHLAEATILESNYTSICPGASSLSDCRTKQICSSFKEEKASFLNSLENYGPTSTILTQKTFKDRMFQNVKHLCGGFEEFVRTHSQNPCRSLPQEQYANCYELQIMSRDDVHKNLIAAFANQLSQSSDPEDKRRAGFFSAHGMIGVSEADERLETTISSNAVVAAKRQVIATQMNQMRERLGPKASQEAIMLGLQQEMKQSFSQAKEAYLASNGLVQNTKVSASVTQVSAQPTSFIAPPVAIENPRMANSITSSPATLSPLPQSIPSPTNNIESMGGVDLAGLRNEVNDLKNSIARNTNTVVEASRQSGPARGAKTQKIKESTIEKPVVEESSAVASPSVSSSFSNGGPRRRQPASINSSAPQSQVQAQAFTPPAGAVVYNSVAEAVTSLDQARIQGGGQLKLRAASTQTSKSGVPLDQVLTVSVMDASNVDQVIEGIRAQFNSQILAENEVKFVEVRDGGKSTIYKVQKVNGELVIEEAVSPEEVASGVLIESAARQPRVVKFSLSGLSQRLNEAIQRD